jgi:hypothetical protein
MVISLKGHFERDMKAYPAPVAQTIHALTGALIRPGCSDTDTGLVPGGNSRRLLTDVLA